MEETLLELYAYYRPWYDEVYDLDHETGNTALTVLATVMIAAGLPKPDDWPEDMDWS